MMKQAASEKAKVRTSSLDSPRTAHSQGWFSPPLGLCSVYVVRCHSLPTFPLPVVYCSPGSTE